MTDDNAKQGIVTLDDVAEPTQELATAKSPLSTGITDAMMSSAASMSDEQIDAEIAKISGERNPANVECIAEMVHDATRTFYRHIENPSQLSPWELSDEGYKQTIRDGVIHLLDNPFCQAGELHNFWMQNRQISGWVYGDTYDASKMTDPMMVAFGELDVHEQIRYQVFVKLTQAFMLA